jgi:hypothetical protein
MANSFSKEERVAFENILEGFQDALVLSRNVSVYNTDQAMMERANNTIWRPMPYIAESINAAPGTDISGSYKNMTQLSVPSTIGFSKSVPFTLNALELRDALQEGRLGDAAKQKLASDINEQGVPNYDRFLALSTRDYNGMANDLSKASRSFGNTKSDSAYERAFVGQVSSFDTFKLDYANRQAAAAGGGSKTISTLVGAANFLVPAATSTSVGGQINVDNRYQTVTVSATASVAAGDCFTIAGVTSVHHITKQDTGQLKTFRVISVVNGTYQRPRW